MNYIQKKIFEETLKNNWLLRFAELNQHLDFGHCFEFISWTSCRIHYILSATWTHYLLLSSRKHWLVLLRWHFQQRIHLLHCPQFRTQDPGHVFPAVWSSLFSGIEYCCTVEVVQYSCQTKWFWTFLASSASKQILHFWKFRPHTIEVKLL